MLVPLPSHPHPFLSPQDGNSEAKPQHTGFFVDKIGRRPLFLISTAGMCISFVIWTVLSERFSATQVKANGSAVVAMIFLYYTFYNIAWSGLLVSYTVEILPYSIRAKGMCYMFAMVDVALFFNTYVNPIALEKIAWRYYIVYVSVPCSFFCGLGRGEEVLGKS